MTAASVIIAAYNSEAFITDALASVLAQADVSLEVIVVDDASVDGTLARAQITCASDHRVRLLQLPINSGPGAARNAGLEAARGKWIAILDADDTFAPNRLKHLIAAAEARGLDAVADNLLMIDGDTRQEMGRAFPSPWMSQSVDLTLRDLIFRDGPRQGAARALGFMKPIMRAAFLDAHRLRYAENVRVGEDFLFYTNLLLAGARIGMVDRALYHYSVRSGSMSSDPSALEAQLIVNDRAVALARRAGQQAEVVALLERGGALRYGLVLRLMKARRFTPALAELKRLTLGQLWSGIMITLLRRRRIQPRLQTGSEF